MASEKVCWGKNQQQFDSINPQSTDHLLVSFCLHNCVRSMNVAMVWIVEEKPDNITLLPGIKNSWSTSGNSACDQLLYLYQLRHHVRTGRLFYESIHAKA
jgi:hypothetical protein